MEGLPATPENVSTVESAGKYHPIDSGFNKAQSLVPHEWVESGLRESRAGVQKSFQTFVAFDRDREIPAREPDCWVG